MHLLPTPFCPALRETHWQKRRCCLNGGMPNNSFSFSLFSSFCVGPIWPHVLHQVCISLIPLSFNPPLHIYTPAARNEWFTWRGSLPPSESFATIHYSPASISLISLCCVTLEKPLRSRTCFFFFSTLSLLLFLWVTFSIDCLCFLMLWRGPGACGWGKSALLDTLTPP